MRNFPAAERLSQAPIYKSGVSESPAVEVEALQPDVVSLSPDDVYAYSSSSPPRFEVMPELPGQDLSEDIELFHLQVRQGEVGRAKHEEELNELVNLLNRVPESGGQPEVLMLQREGILELLDFVKEPFFCHQMWLLCQIAS